MLLLSAWITVFGAAGKETFFNNAQSKAESEQEQLQNKLLWINHINLVVTKILTYNDKLVLTLEYEKLVDSINYNNLPDGPLRDAIKELIRTLKNLSDSWDQKEIVRKEYIKACDKAFREALFKGMKTGYNTVKTAFTLDLKSVINEAGDAAASFISYQDQKELLADENEKKMREIAREDARRIHELRNRIWDVFSAEFSRKGLHDQDRVSVQDCKSFMNILKNGTVTGQYTVLSGLNNQTRFRNLPVYWYYLGYTAGKLNKNAEALDYLSRFKKIYRNLFRYDQYAANTLILETRILMQNPGRNKTKILANLEELVKNIENRDWRSRYFAALCYFQLKDPDTAIKLLEQNVEYLTIQTREATNPPRRNLFGEVNIPMEFLPDGESLAVNRHLLAMARLRRGEAPEKVIPRLMNDFAVSTYEKAEYLGAVDRQAILRLIEKDIRGISVKMHHRVMKSYVEIQMPAPWFYISLPPVITLDFIDSAMKNTIPWNGKYSSLGWNAENRSVILAFAVKSSITIPNQTENLVMTIRSHGLSLKIHYRMFKPVTENQEKKAETKWGKIQSWSKQKIKQGKDAWARTYQYQLENITINDQTIPLSAAFGKGQ